MRLFGFEIRKQETKPALVTPVTNDGAVNNEISPGTSGAYGYYFDINRKLSNEIDLINKYRSMANTPEIDIAIDDIVNEMINISDDAQPIVANVRSENVGEVERFPQKSLIEIAPVENVPDPPASVNQVVPRYAFKLFPRLNSALI